MKIMKRFLPAVLALLIATPAFAGLTFSSIKRESAGSEAKVYGTLAFDSSYPTGGEAFSLSQLGVNSVSNVLLDNTSGYIFSYDYTNNKLIVYQSGAGSVSISSTSAGTPSGTNSTSTAAAQTFTGTTPTAALNYASPAFSGTGQSSSGQVITTSDNQTMTLNQCTGMWFVSATHGPYLIASNTAVSGAPAVVTIYGTAPTTDAGTYKILRALAPVGTNGTSSVSAQTFTGDALATHTHTATGTAGALAQVPNTTNLATLTGVKFVIYGK